jgi:hypothetical protein
MENEKTIIQAILSGAGKYEELVRIYHVGLIIHCEHLVGDRDDAKTSPRKHLQRHIQFSQLNEL